MNKITKHFTRILQLLLLIALGVLGIFLILLLFRELIPLGQQLVSSSITSSNEKILDEIIVFFLFFEFAVLVISAIKHHGHTNVEFLMELGITALVRSLLTAHHNSMDTLFTAIAILLIIIAMVLYHKFDNEKI